jgi:hypothetical protein
MVTVKVDLKENRIFAEKGTGQETRNAPSELAPPTCRRLNRNRSGMSTNDADQLLPHWTWRIRYKNVARSCAEACLHASLQVGHAGLPEADGPRVVRRDQPVPGHGTEGHRAVRVGLLVPGRVGGHLGSFRHRDVSHLAQDIASYSYVPV